MISAKPWSIEAVARLFFCVIMTLCAGAMLAGLLESARLGLTPARRQFLEMIVMVAFFQGAALVWITIFLRNSKTSWREAFGLRPASPVKAMAFGVGAGVAFLPVAWLVQMLSQRAMELMHVKVVAQAAVEELQNNTLSGPEKILMGVFTVLLAPIAEEALFRGILYPTIKQTGYPRLALWGTSLAFGIMHVNMATFVPLVLLAVLLTYLYESSGSLLAPMAAHGVFNAVNYFYLIFADPINRLLHLQ